MSRLTKFEDDIASTSTIMSLLISTYAIVSHLANYTEPQIQLYMIRILLMIPVTIFQELASILIIVGLFHLQLARTHVPQGRFNFKYHERYVNRLNLNFSYEAYVLYTFMQLLIHYLGGETNLVVHLEFKVEN